MDLTVVATCNVHVSASDAATVADLRALLAEADILVVQEVPSAGKKAVIGELNTFPASAPDRSFDQWWFRPPTQTGFRPLEHHTFAGASDHLGVVVSFAVQ